MQYTYSAAWHTVRPERIWNGEGKKNTMIFLIKSYIFELRRPMNSIQHLCLASLGCLARPGRRTLCGTWLVVVVLHKHRLRCQWWNWLPPGTVQIRRNRKMSDMHGKHCVSELNIIENHDFSSFPFISVSRVITHWSGQAQSYNIVNCTAPATCECDDAPKRLHFSHGWRPNSSPCVRFAGTEAMASMASMTRSPSPADIPFWRKLKLFKRAKELDDPLQVHRTQINQIKS